MNSRIVSHEDQQSLMIQACIHPHPAREESPRRGNAASSEELGVRDRARSRGRSIVELGEEELLQVSLLPDEDIEELYEELVLEQGLPSSVGVPPEA